MTIDELRVKIFADGAVLADMAALCQTPYIRGFTTNPTLMLKANVSDYETFARKALVAVEGRPISFEVLADDFPEMERQANEIASWADNVYVKIPITNTVGESSCGLVHRLSRSGIKINVTAVLTLDQVEQAADALRGGAASTISIFAGRIADTGRDPVPLICRACSVIERTPSAELIWASPREVLNVLQADAAGCHIITLTTDLLGKLQLLGKDLDEFSLETVRMFHDDAARAGLALKARGQPV